LPEYALTPVAEIVLGKDRILELYLNEIEWGPGVWGAGAAAEFHYDKPAERLGRNEAARLAACVPAPRTRRPNRMDAYSSIIL
jgi:monofunctional biosynthetic peptidoglycan transglycosylase